MNAVTIPMYQRNASGALIANKAFHRSHDRLHSRCIEYPFAAEGLGACKGKVLDIGSAKSEPLWLQWLCASSAEVHCVDFDEWRFPPEGIRFVRSDARQLPFESQTFDAVLAVSVVEHIGLASCQVEQETQPSVSESGDSEAVKEFARVLKKGGKLILTVPFGTSFKLFGGDARCYDYATLGRLIPEELAPLQICYFEYQHRDTKTIALEASGIPAVNKSLWTRFLRAAKKFSSRRSGLQRSEAAREGCHIVEEAVRDFSEEFGSVVWREIPLSESRSTNASHIDGVVGLILERR